MNVNSRSESSVAATAAAVPAGRVTENEAIDRRFKELDERLERIEKSQKKSAKEVKDLTDRVQKLVSLTHYTLPAAFRFTYRNSTCLSLLFLNNLNINM